MARQAGVRKIKKFETCIASNRFRARIQQDMRDADSVGIRGTPGFFIGTMGSDGMLEGEILSGAQPLENFVSVIEAIRKRRKGQRK